MNKKQLTTVAICRAGIIAALYVVLTMPFGPLAFGPFQIRPSEALTILPLFYWEAIPGLYVGCMLANAASEFGLFDIFLGSIASLLAAVCTYFVGRVIKNKIVKVIVGGIFPVILNAFIVPAVWVLAGFDFAYWYNFATMILNEGVWVYATGIPLFLVVDRLIKRKVRVMLPVSLIKKTPAKCDNSSENPTISG